MDNDQPKASDDSVHEEEQLQHQPTPSSNAQEPLRLGGVIQAGTVEVSRGATLAIIANEARVQQAASIITIAEELSLKQGGSQWLIAGEAELEQSGAGIVIAREVEAPNARIGAIIGGEVEGNLQVGILLAGRVEGDVQALMDTPTAIRFGAAFGAVVGFFLLLRRFIGGR